MNSPIRLDYLGHATVRIDFGPNKVSLLTDPLLSDRVVHLRRHAPSPDRESYQSIDAVLISHQHLDHFHIPSLRQLSPDVQVIAPKGTAARLNSVGFSNVIEMEVGDAVGLMGVSVEATHARHSGRRIFPGSEVQPLGYIIGEGRRIYFAGDTDIFPEMAQLAGRIDVALLPVWGWGPNLGPGHLDPYRAALALTYLKPSIAIPIHWGTFHPIGLRWFRPASLIEPPTIFNLFASRMAPEVEVRILEPGSGTEID